VGKWRNFYSIDRGASIDEVHLIAERKELF
jgi:hypothetical protein